MKVETYIRAPEPDDMAFIYSSWLKSLQPSLRSIERRRYFRSHKDLIDSILSRSNILVCCNPEALTQIFGYAIYEVRNKRIILHYIYAKHTYRKLGIATELYKLLLDLRIDKAKPLYCSHHTPAVDEFLSRWDVVFNPYILLNQEGEDK